MNLFNVHIIIRQIILRELVKWLLTQYRSTYLRWCAVSNAIVNHTRVYPIKYHDARTGHLDISCIKSQFTSPARANTEREGISDLLPPQGVGIPWPHLCLPQSPLHSCVVQIRFSCERTTHTGCVIVQELVGLRGVRLGDDDSNYQILLTRIAM